MPEESVILSIGQVQQLCSEMDSLTTIVPATESKLSQAFQVLHTPKQKETKMPSTVTKGKNKNTFPVPYYRQAQLRLDRKLH